MSRFTNIVLCPLALALCLAALPASTAQEYSVDSHGRIIVTVPPSTTGPSPNVAKPATAKPEGTTIVYSNLGSGDSYQCCVGWSENGTGAYNPGIQAMAFTPTKATYILTQLDLALGYLSYGMNGVTVELRLDDDGIPGKLIDSWYITGLPVWASTSNIVQTIKVEKHILLIQNHQYFLVAVPNSNEAAGWNFNSVGASGHGAFLNEYSGNVWEPGDFSPNGAFEVLGRVWPERRCE